MQNIKFAYELIYSRFTSDVIWIEASRIIFFIFILFFNTNGKGLKTFLLLPGFTLERFIQFLSLLSVTIERVGKWWWCLILLHLCFLYIYSFLYMCNRCIQGLFRKGAFDIRSYKGHLDFWPHFTHVGKKTRLKPHNAQTFRHIKHFSVYEFYWAEY